MSTAVITVTVDAPPLAGVITTNIIPVGGIYHTPVGISGNTVTVTGATGDPLLSHWIPSAGVGTRVSIAPADYSNPTGAHLVGTLAYGPGSNPVYWLAVSTFGCMSITAPFPTPLGIWCP
jgi:hypothetical protein